MKTWFENAFKFFLWMTALTGFIYPALVTGFSWIAFHDKANGSMIITQTGQSIGSELIAQGFKDPKYFWPRPSSVDYNPMPSGGSNLGPTSATSSPR